MRGLIFVLRTILSLLNTIFQEHFARYHHGVGASGLRAGRIIYFAPYRINHIALRHGDIPCLDLGKSRVGLKPLQLLGLSRATPQKQKHQFPKSKLTSFLGDAFGELAECSHRGGLQA